MKKVITALRWEDDATIWSGPSYRDHVINYSPEVKEAPVSGRLLTCVDVVDWDGDGGKDLILSSWDACYDGQVYLRKQIGERQDGTPLLGDEEVIQGVRGFVTAAKDRETFHLISCSRIRKEVHIYPNVGTTSNPKFGKPIPLNLDVDWVKDNEFLHIARFYDLDGDGVPELIVGTDFWDDYWPNGLEWNEPGYLGFDQASRWLGGPLRGFIYVFKNRGSLSNPKLEHGKPILCGERPLEVYGQLAPAFGDFNGLGKQTLVCGEFWNILHFAHQKGPLNFDSPRLISDKNYRTLDLDHCIQFPCAVDWDNDGMLDILTASEDGYVTFLQNEGTDRHGNIFFKKVGRVETNQPLIHAGVLPCPAAFDFTGNGLPDLVVGNSTGELLFYENCGPPEEPFLSREVFIEAGGMPVRISAGLSGSIQGPSEKMFGYSCPTIADWDGNGIPDLLVSDVTGFHSFYQNSGQVGVPKFNVPRLLTFENKPLKTVWRVRPAVVDWLSNGQLHYLTLDENGVLSDFKRYSDTVLVEKKILRWVNGGEMMFTQDVGGGRGRVKLCICDWTGDGLFDIIVGTHARASVPPEKNGGPRFTTSQAGIFLLRNVGTEAEPLFEFPHPFKFGGELIQMGMHVASPEAVDWNRNGKLGLLVGIEDGSIVWLPRDKLSW